jgi:hypothetical protein
MTVRIADGRATIPLWAAITLIVTVLLATIGWVALATEKANNTEHQALDSRLLKVENVMKAIPDIQKDVAVILAIMAEKEKNK